MTRLVDNPAAKTETGRRGEALALRAYRKTGFELLARNYRCGHYEIDLILKDKRTGTVVFCEVKARSDGTRAFPREAVGRTKQTYLRRAAQRFLIERELTDAPCRFDVAEVWLDIGKTELIENAF